MSDFPKGAKMVPIRKFTAEDIALIYRVPYWLCDGRPRPSWLRRPIWRARALYWRIRY